MGKRLGLTAMKACHVARLGLVDYQAAWDLQKRLAAARADAEIEDTLLLLEHPHTYTLGSSGKEANLLWEGAERAARGVDVVRVDRGGDITYHGPGQLVGYPILHLGRLRENGGVRRADYVAYIRQLEATLIRTLAEFGVTAHAERGFTGVWTDDPVEPRKIAAIGVRVSAAEVSTHGFALNVSTDLSYFEGIVPCGIPDRPVTSLSKELGREVKMEAVMDVVEGTFAAEFEREMRPLRDDEQAGIFAAL